MKPNAVVLAEHVARLPLDDWTRRRSAVLLYELVPRHFAQKTNALAVLAIGGRYLHGRCKRAHLRLRQVAERKQHAAQLCLSELTEKVRLVLNIISAWQQSTRSHFVRVVLNACVVPACDVLELALVVLHVLKEGAKLDARVAQHIRVRRPSILDLVNCVGDDSIPVRVCERYDFDFNARELRRRLCELEVLLPRACVPRVAKVLLEPNFEVKRRHFVSCSL
mmetsp:Transcript_80/g.234  ORF Transcript_80/g.234 Transcript_80/m.234 type:complete len:222 (-) Transcript_80:290-955(-)